MYSEVLLRQLQLYILSRLECNIASWGKRNSKTGRTTRLRRVEHRDRGRAYGTDVTDNINNRKIIIGKIIIWS